MKSMTGQNMKLKTIIPYVALSLAACSTAYPPRDTSTLERINDQLKQAAVPMAKPAEPVVPPAVSSSLLPPARTLLPKTSKQQLEQRFDLVVTDAPIHQVLMGIVADTPYSVMVKPKSATPSSPGTAPGAAAIAVTGLTDRVTVNLKNVTMFEALDAIREVYGYDYTMEGNRIYVQQPELQTRLYQVNYIIGQRRGVSDLQVIGGASVGSSSGSTGGSSSSGSSGSSGASSGSFSSVQASALSSMSKSDIWGEVEDTLRTTLGCQIPKNQASQTTGQGSSSSSSSSSGTASRADVSFVGDNTRPGERQRGVDGCAEGRAMNINQMSGTILVRGMPNEHRMITQMLRSMQLNIERQVIIEAKIIDVQLNAGSQQGINWAGFQNNVHRYSVGANTTTIDGTNAETGGGINGGVVAAGTTLAGLLGTGLVGATGTAFSAGLGLAVQFRNFSALINFLQTQGNVQVLSSPRIATLNNQKAVLKVGTEEAFVTSISGGSTTVAAGAAPLTQPPNLNYQPFFAGISLDVTPQIDDKDNITLHVHAMVNSITESAKISQPVAGAVMVPFAVNTISETDSVVKAKDGQVIVIGGLMTESASDNRSKVPGAGDVPGVGALTSKGGQRSAKRELVILLKPTVVKDDGTWSNDIGATQGRIEGFRPPPAPPASQ